MRAYTTPLLIEEMGRPSQRCRPLAALPLRTGQAGAYDERWVQELIHAHPAVLPVAQIEPAMWDLRPVCMELALPSGFVDNLMMTPDGDLVMVENKLWRNPEARRAVIGQVLDYAKDLSQWRFEQLEVAVRLACKSPALRLYHHVCGPDLSADGEAPFIDAVSRNLRLGRFLLLIVGDGVTENLEQLTDFLQLHVALHFSLGLVELSLWRAPETGQVLVQPRILAHTVQIERAVVRIEAAAGADRVRIEPTAQNVSARTTITGEQFYEALGQIDPQLPSKLKAFLEQLEGLGVYAEQRGMLSLKWRDADGREFNLGVIDSGGRFFTDYCFAAPAAIGRLDACHHYKEALAGLIPGAQVKPTTKAMGLQLVIPAQAGVIARLLDRAPDWLAVIGDYVAELQSDAEDVAASSGG